MDLRVFTSVAKGPESAAKGFAKGLDTTQVGVLNFWNPHISQQQLVFGF